MRKIRVHLNNRSYDIVIGHHAVERCAGLLKRLDIGRDAVVITNRRLMRLYGKRLKLALGGPDVFKVRFWTVPDSERAKSAEVSMRLLNKIAAFDTRKDIFIIAFGGGVIGDLAGFVAAVYKRGIPYVQIPTTLLAQVDSSIGGKVAIDLPVAKNMVGAFYQPKLVISDTSLLESLSVQQIRNGLAEVIKYGTIKDSALFRFLEDNYAQILRGDKKALSHIVATSIGIKARVIEKDEFDKKGIRIILNYGHTLGHAIEAASSYSGRYSHGEAIAIGMVAAAKISVKMGIGKRDMLSRIERLVTCCGLPTSVKDVRYSDIYKAHLHDKKFTNTKNRFVVPVKIGEIKTLEGVSDGIVREIVRGLAPNS